MERMRVLLAVTLAGAWFAPAASAQEAGPAYGVSDTVAVSAEQTAIIGTTTQDLADTGFAYYEIVDDLGVLDYGYLPFAADGAFRTYLSADLSQAVVGDPLLLLYDPLDGDPSSSLQVNCMTDVTCQPSEVTLPLPFNLEDIDDEDFYVDLVTAIQNLQGGLANARAAAVPPPVPAQPGATPTQPTETFGWLQELFNGLLSLVPAPPRDNSYQGQKPVPGAQPAPGIAGPPGSNGNGPGVVAP